jgi:hypothetical protein
MDIAFCMDYQKLNYLALIGHVSFVYRIAYLDIMAASYTRKVTRKG